MGVRSGRKVKEINDREKKFITSLDRALKRVGTNRKLFIERNNLYRDLFTDANKGKTYLSHEELKNIEKVAFSFLIDYRVSKGCKRKLIKELIRNKVTSKQIADVLGTDVVSVERWYSLSKKITIVMNDREYVVLSKNLDKLI